MNPHLQKLQTYPFEKLKQLFSDITPNPNYSHISLGIGEPQHPTPILITNTLTQHLTGLANYPTTQGNEILRNAIANWLKRRYQLKEINPNTQVLPVNGSREALFGIAQTVINTEKSKPLVMCPNPFYQIYEGAAYLAGATPYFVAADPNRNFAPDYHLVPQHIWENVQLIYVCSPGNPTGAVLPLAEWKKLFELSDQYNFVIASDECYSEIYFDHQAPLGALEAAQQLGRNDYRNLITFSSLSKRSNVPGMRSGFVAGDTNLIKQFLLYRTYAGGAMSPPIQQASITAWNDEEHVTQNREKYNAKFKEITPLLQSVLDVKLPDAGFYLWANVSQHTTLDDTSFAKALYHQYNVTVLPGSYLSRTIDNINPGKNYIRMALVAEHAQCLEATHRIIQFIQQHSL